MIYLDNAASTPVDKQVVKAMIPYWREDFANPSSLHNLGKQARQSLQSARITVANFLACSLEEVVFTSGATESDNLAIKSVIKGILNQTEANSAENCICCKVFKPHIITLKIEHYAVLKPCEEMQKMGMAETTFLGVGSDGIVSLEDFKKAIKPNTRLVSIMYANNEIGAIQPIKEISQIIREENQKRSENMRIYFHTDAAQGYCLDCNVNSLGVDLLSFSAHKFGGPKGAGVLFARHFVPFLPIINGGAQENGKRAGTVNIPAVMGLKKALEDLDAKDFRKIEKLRNLLIKKVEKEIAGAKLIGSRQKRVYGNANFSFTGVEGESLMMKLSDKGFAVSTGSACTAGTSQASYVLESLNLPGQEIRSSIRISLGKQNTRKEILAFIEALKKSVEELREIAGKN
ncbi:MAG: cysteine desulfurase family protein [bacterium]